MGEWIDEWEEKGDLGNRFFGEFINEVRERTEQNRTAAVRVGSRVE